MTKTLLAAAVLAIACANALPIDARPVRTGDTITTASGLRYVITKAGKGQRAKAGQLAVVHYAGRLLNGRGFDSSTDRGPIAFRIGGGQVIKGWDEAFALLRVGDRATLIIPPGLAYGERAIDDRIPAGSTLVFDVQLVELYDHSVGEELQKALEDKGIDVMRRTYESLKKKKFKGYYLSESEINRIGYGYMMQTRYPEAVAILRINVDAFPKSSNVYDSLGEAYMLNGDTRLAIQNYRRSLEMDPSNSNAKDMIRKLESGAE